jgi:hypothetical protein
VIDSSGIIAVPFREQVLVFQNDVNMRTRDPLPRLCPGNAGPVGGGVFGAAVENLACLEDPEDTGLKAINYRTEPLWKRMQHPPGTMFPDTNDFPDWYDVLSNTKIGGFEPETPVFHVNAGTPVRFRVLQPGGHPRNIVFALHGHIWDREPYVNGSTQIGPNGLSFWEGARMGHGPSNHFDAVLRNGAGGKFSILGDYLFRDQVGTGLDNGLWGLMIVK